MIPLLKRRHGQRGWQGFVVVADDDPVQLGELRDMVQSAGAPVISCRNGEQAFETIRSSRARLAFLDVRMPGKTGFEVAKLAARLPYRPQIVLFSGMPGAGGYLHGDFAHFTHFLNKPLKADEVAQLVSQYAR